MDEQKIHTKNAIVVFGFLIVIIGLSAVIPAKWLGGAQKKEEHFRLDLSAISLPQEVAKDSNSDGTVSWKEIMDDTLQATPEQLAELKKIPVDPKVIEELNDPNNLTSSFSKNLYLTAAYLDKNNITDQKTKDEALAKLMQEEKDKITSETYDYKDINVAKTETKESIKAYGNAVASILQETITEEITKKDVYAIVTYTESKNKDDLKDLLIHKKKLDELLKKLLAVSVPQSFSIYQIITLNKIAAYRDVVEAFSKADSDPLRATIMINMYPEKTLPLFRLYKMFSNEFLSRNIVFSSKESGYVFTTGYSLNFK